MTQSTPKWASKVPADMVHHPLVSAAPRPRMGRKLSGGGYGWNEGEGPQFELSELSEMPTMSEQYALALAGK